MTFIRTLAAFAAVAAVVGCALADDKKKELKLPPLDAKEWKEVKGQDGLKSWDSTEGKGDEVKAGETVEVHYTGWLKDGTIFDSSVKRGETASFPLGRVIKGWQVGIPGMKPGGTRRLYIPSALAYGKDGFGNEIPPDSDLIFEIELIKVKK